MRDRYDLHEELGRGAMGVVYRATDRELHRDVALKLVARSIADEAESLARFRREMAAAAAIAHPNVIRVFESGACDEGLYFTMELLDAAPYEDHVAVGAVPAAQVGHVLGQISDALAALHERGIVHRDVKPSNIMLSPAGHATLMDFGLVHLPDRSVLTVPGQMLGTPLYMAPEIWTGDGFGPHSDVYSLGLTCWRALTGKFPTKSRSAAALAAWAVREGATSLAESSPGTPGWLAGLVDRMVCIEANARPTAAEVAKACRENLAPKGSPQPIERRPRRTARREKPAAPKTARRSPVVMAGGVVVLALTLISAALSLRQTQAPLVAPRSATPMPSVSTCAVRGLVALPAATRAVVDFTLDPPCGAVVRVAGVEVRHAGGRRFNHVFGGLLPDKAYEVDIALADAPPGAVGLRGWPFRTLKASTATALDALARSVKTGRPGVDIASDSWRQLVMRLMSELQREGYPEAAATIADAVARMSGTDVRVRSWTGSTALAVRSGAMLSALLKRLAPDEDHDVMFHALLAAHRLGDPSARDLATRFLRGPAGRVDAGVFMAVAESLPPGVASCGLIAETVARWKPHRAREAAAAMIRADRGTARARFEDWARRAEEDRAAPLMKEFDTDAAPLPYEGTAVPGLHGLAQLGTPADVARLRKIGVSGHAVFRPVSELVLAEARPPGAAFVLEEIVRAHPDEASGYWFLGLVAPGAAAAHATHLLASQPESPAAAGAAAALGLSGTPLGQAACDALLAGLSGKNANARLLAAWALGQRREPRARAKLRALAVDDDPRGVAAWALARCGAPEDREMLAGLVDRLRVAGAGAANGRMAAVVAGLASTSTGEGPARAALDRLAADTTWPVNVRALATPRPGAHTVFPFVPQLPLDQRAGAGDVLTASVAGSFFSSTGVEDDGFLVTLRQCGRDGLLLARTPKSWVVERGGELIVSTCTGGRSDPWWTKEPSQLVGVALVTLGR